MKENKYIYTICNIVMHAAAIFTGIFFQLLWFPTNSYNNLLWGAICGFFVVPYFISMIATLLLRFFFSSESDFMRNDRPYIVMLIVSNFILYNIGKLIIPKIIPFEHQKTLLIGLKSVVLLAIVILCIFIVSNAINVSKNNN